MHRRPEPHVEARLARWAPFILGGAVAVVLVALAVFIRFAGDSGDDSAAELATSGPDATAVSSTLEPSTSAPEASTTTSTTEATTTTTAPVTSPTTGAASDGDDQADGTDTVAPADLGDAGSRYGGVVTLGVVGDLESLNPFGDDGNSDPTLAITRAVTTGAIRLDPITFDPVPLAVESIPSVENGGLEVDANGELVVRMTIREDAIWADGTPITVADFERTLEVARFASGVRSDVRDRYAAVVPGSVVGEGNIVEYRLRAPGLDYVSLFDVLVPAHAVSVSGFSSAWNDEAWPAGGPFRFFEADPEGGQTRLVANQRSWLTSEDGSDPLPYLDGIVVMHYPTRDALVRALRAGDASVAAVGSDPTVLEVLSDDQSLLLDVQRGPAWEQIGFQFGSGRTDVNAGSVVAAPEVRNAIAVLLDRGALAAEVQGDFGRPLDSVIGLGWPAAASDAWTAIDEGDTEAAAEVLAAIATAADEPPVVSFSTTANDPDREATARALVAALEPLGFVVEVTRDEPGAYFLDRVIPGNFELAAWAWEAGHGPVGSMTDLVDHHLVDWPDGTDFYHWRAAEDGGFGSFEAELNALSREPDPAQAARGLVQLEQSLAEAVVFIPLYPELNGAAARHDDVAGFRHSALPGGEAASIAEWWVPSSG